MLPSNPIRNIFTRNLLERHNNVVITTLELESQLSKLGHVKKIINKNCMLTVQFFIFFQ